MSTSNPSPNFEVMYDHPGGLLFANRRDKKVLDIDPSVGLSKQTLGELTC